MIQLDRLIERFPDAKIFRYSAIAEEDERNRSKGEALFPEHKSLSFLLERKKAMTQASWESEYQQNPIVVGGGIFPIEKLRIVRYLDRAQIKRACGTSTRRGPQDGGAYTAGVLMHVMMDDTFVISTSRVASGRALEREQQIKTLGDADAKLIPAPTRWRRAGAGQRRQGERAGDRAESSPAPVFVDRGHRIQKEVRAEPLVAQVPGRQRAAGRRRLGPRLVCRDGGPGRRQSTRTRSTLAPVPSTG